MERNVAKNVVGQRKRCHPRYRNRW